jgi:hypothetical protein
MIFTYKFVPDHKAYKLHNYIVAFFNKITGLDNSTPFSITLFEADFQPFLVERSNNQTIPNTLQNLFKNFYEAYISLPTLLERQSVNNAFQNNNSIEILCSNNSISSIKLNSLDEIIQKPTKELFEYLYSTTLKRVDFNIQNHYEEFDKLNTNRICGFCGIDSLVSPKTGDNYYQQDYDHLLDIGSYPFSAVNFKNIVPICEKCNSKFKHIKPLLVDDNGKRRKAFHPYLQQVDLHRIIIECPDKLPKGSKDDSVKWTITFVAFNQNQNEEINTWVTVYKIDERYKEIVINQYDSWLKYLITDLRNKKIKNEQGIISCIHIQKRTYLSQKQRVSRCEATRRCGFLLRAGWLFK